MTITRFHKMISLTLAFLMFFTSTGFSIDVHYCKDEFKSISFFSEAKPCHEKKAVCPQHAKMQIEQGKDCCSNQSIVIDDLDVDYDYQTPTELTNIQFSIIFSYLITEYTFNLLHTETSIFPATENTQTSRDIYALLDRFLI